MSKVKNTKRDMRRMYRKISIGERQLGGDAPVFIIAEIGCNFEGDIDRAKEMIRVIAKAGADAAKLQTFIPEKLVSKYAEKFWEIEGCVGKTQLEEFREMPKLNFRQYRLLKKEAEKAGIILFSTPCDEESVDMLERLDMPLYKISSMDITHIPLLKYIAKKKKPVIISTGASTIDEIKEAVETIRNMGNSQIALLHCITNYPTDDRCVNLMMIKHLQEVFPDVPIGYSDHTLPQDGEGILVAAVALGARIIEKHFTFDNKRPGYDHVISVDYEGLRRLVTQIRRVEKALGQTYKRPIKSEVKARIYGRRSIVASQRIPKGTIIMRSMLEVKRPGMGIEPKNLDIVIGKKAKIDILDDTVLNWDMII